MSKNKFNVLSLFSGAGGMDLGFMLSNKFRVLFANDILPDSAATYAENFHSVIINPCEISLGLNPPKYVLGDIAEVDFDFLRSKNPDVVIGGPPCQDFSVVRAYAREKHGIEVTGRRLFFSTVDSKEVHGEAGGLLSFRYKDKKAYDLLGPELDSMWDADLVLAKKCIEMGINKDQPFVRSLFGFFFETQLLYSKDHL